MLSPPITPDALRDLRSSVAGALDSGEAAVTVDLDALGGLETAVIACLITLLRDARGHGATLGLRASRAGVLDDLRTTGLDRIFAVAPSAPTGDSREATGASAAVRARARCSGRRRRTIAMLVGALVGILVSQASAASELGPQDVVENIIAQNADMRSYQAQVGVNIRLRSFPYLSEHLDGTTYFKRPDNFEVVFASVPGYAKGFDRIYSDIGDPTSWARRFDLTLAGLRPVDGRRDLVLRLVQKVRGMIDHEDVAVDPRTWHVDEIEWHYYNGGVIAMSQEYQMVGGFTVLARQHATIRIPFVHAAADATYDDYRTNVAIDDNVFTREKR